tara:strand:+ start:1576 stop:3015 length:1440 start_codon:yes stop_codon:yes gene_type:complete
MLNNLRNFAKTKLAGVLIGIIIIPFVFWGMGGVFSGGNKNNIAKINNKSISTKDFVDHLNSSNIDLEKIKNNVENNIIEENLSKLISSTMLSMEIKDLNLIVSDKVLNKIIKANKSFHNENGNFSRTEYEKFLLSTNIPATDFEKRLREDELKNKLFYYIGGGINSPIFLINNTFRNQTKKININFIKLENVYKKKENFSNEEIVTFIDKNKEGLKEKSINFTYAKITPKNLIGINEFNNLFFEKIDEIENEISNQVNIENLLKKYDLKSFKKENFKLNNITDENNIFYKKIYKNAEINKIELLDENDFYILYEITKVEEKLPNINDENFNLKVKNMLFNKTKFEFNNNLIKNINDEKFTQSDFEKLANTSLSEIENIEISSINDTAKFSIEGVKFLYTLSKNDFALVGDKDKNIYLIKITNIYGTDISKNSDNFSLYKKQTNIKIIESINNSYNIFLNNKYKVKVNDQTLERVKNYFQ